MRAGAPPGSAHVLVLGPSKTGTSGVYNSVKAGLRDAGIAAHTLFEPQSRELVHNLFRLDPGVPVLVKLPLHKLRPVGLDVQAFDRRLMTVRDPRDAAISLLLFRPLTERVTKSVDEDRIRAFVADLRRKEADPSAVSVRELFERSTELGLGEPVERLFQAPLGRQRKLLDHGDFHVVRYERFVADELDDVSDYLGFGVRNRSARSSGMYGFIARSEGTGAFRSWFRPDDLAYFNALFTPHLERLGYPLDVELAAQPEIDPATSSEYVWTNYRERRRRLQERAAAAHRTSAELDGDPQAMFEQFTERGDNGNPGACLRAAELVLSGRLGSPDPAVALRWARAGAQLGSVPAMALTAQLLRQHGTGPADRREALGWAIERRARRGGQVPALEAELAELRSSTSYRVGRALTDAARGPRRAGMQGLREVVRLWRGRPRPGSET